MFIDALGVAAGIAVIATFYTVVQVRTRLLAIVSNLLFIAYAISADLWPVLALHALLLPLNLWRLDGIWHGDAPHAITPAGYAAARPLRRRAGMPLCGAGELQPPLCRA